ncbi:MAG: ferrous iron transport protein A [Bryobacteraceae bacterium]|nr:ferrous iron transport protein A [Bryobacteraceae bacterium]
MRTLASLRQGDSAILERLELPDAFAHRLMQLGFIPGMLVEAAHQAPGGDPRVYRVDGSEIALRQETAARMFIANELQELRNALD